MKDLTKKQSAAIIALLESRSVVEAGQKCKLSIRTLFRYLQNPQFAEAYRKARHEQLTQAVAQLQRLSGQATAVLETIMNDEYVRASARVMACRTVIVSALKGVDWEDLEHRIRTLEYRAGLPLVESAPQFDISRLSPDELVELEQLNQKMLAP